MTRAAPKPHATRTSGDYAFHKQRSFVSADLPVLEWKPLRSWPAVPHPREAEIRALCDGTLGRDQPLLFGKLAR